MASGKTLELNQFDSMMQWRSVHPEPKKNRNRTLRGKARIKARKRQNKLAKFLESAPLGVTPKLHDQEK